MLVAPALDSPPPHTMSKAASEMVNGIHALKRDEVLKLVPDEGKSLRGLKTSVGRRTGPYPCLR